MKATGTANMEDLLLHAGWLRRFAVALVKDLDAAEDVVQETLVTAWQRPAENTGRPWLARVARNVSIDLWRSSDRRERREVDAAAMDIGTVVSPEELIGDAQIHRAVAEAVAALEEPFRQTLVLRFFHGGSSTQRKGKIAHVHTHRIHLSCSRRDLPCSHSRPARLGLDRSASWCGTRTQQDD
jgi:RNA polymerase sigma-70 factor (ECF subfamily)